MMFLFTIIAFACFTCIAVPQSTVEASPIPLSYIKNVYAHDHHGVFAPVPSPVNTIVRGLNGDKTKTDAKGIEAGEKADKANKEKKKEKENKVKENNVKEKKEQGVGKTKEKNPSSLINTSTTHICGDLDSNATKIKSGRNLEIEYEYQIKKKSDSMISIERMISMIDEKVPKIISEQIDCSAKRFLRSNEATKYSRVLSDTFNKYVLAVDTLPLDVQSTKAKCRSENSKEECVVVDGYMTLIYDQNATLSNITDFEGAEENLRQVTFQSIQKQMNNGDMDIEINGTVVANVVYLEKENSTENDKKKATTMLVVCICVALAVGIGFGYYKYTENQKQNSEDSVAKPIEAEPVIAEPIGEVSLNKEPVAEACVVSIEK